MEMSAREMRKKRETVSKRAGGQSRREFLATGVKAAAGLAAGAGIGELVLKMRKNAVAQFKASVNSLVPKYQKISHHSEYLAEVEQRISQVGGKQEHVEALNSLALELRIHPHRIIMALRNLPLDETRRKKYLERARKSAADGFATPFQQFDERRLLNLIKVSEKVSKNSSLSELHQKIQKADIMPMNRFDEKYRKAPY